MSQPAPQQMLLNAVETLDIAAAQAPMTRQQHIQIQLAASALREHCRSLTPQSQRTDLPPTPQPST